MLRPPLQPGKYGLKLEVVLKWRDINNEKNIRMVSLISGLKIEGIVQRRGLILQGPLYRQIAPNRAVVPAVQIARWGLFVQRGL